MNNLTINYQKIKATPRTSAIDLIADPNTHYEGLNKIMFNGDNTVYHYTHLFNLIKILKDAKVCSRNYVHNNNINYTESCGSVIDLQQEPHKYARFYLRPKTPTQFYNQDLGLKKQSSYHYSYRELNLPKCPIPVIISFSIDEIIATSENECGISYNNLQKNGQNIHPAVNNNIDNAYTYNRSSYNHSRNHDYRVENKGQSEFVVKDFADLSKLKSLRITVKDTSTKDILINQLKNNDILEEITQLHIFSEKGRIDNGIYKLNLTSFSKTQIYLVCEDEVGIKVKSYFLRDEQRNHLNVENASNEAIDLSVDFDDNYEWIIINKNLNSYICNGENINILEYHLNNVNKLSLQNLKDIEVYFFPKEEVRKLGFCNITEVGPKYLVYSNVLPENSSSVIKLNLLKEIQVHYENNIEYLDPLNLSMANAFKQAKFRSKF